MEDGDCASTMLVAVASGDPTDDAGSDGGRSDGSSTALGSDLSDLSDEMLALIPAENEQRSPRLSPRLKHILTSLEVETVPSVQSCQDALAMHPCALGPKTESVRELATEVVFKEVAGSASVAQQHRSALPAIINPMRTAVPMGGNPIPASAAAVGFPLALAGCAPFALEQRSIGCAPVCCAGQLSAYPSSSSAAANTSAEDAAVNVAITEFLRVAPLPLLFPAHSAVPVPQRIANRRQHLESQGAGSIAAGSRFLRVWTGFCARNEIPNYGVDALDEELFEWFLREEDKLARSRAAEAASRRPGKETAARVGDSVQHSLACAARWCADHAGMPFAVAKKPAVRVKSKPPGREPKAAEMWEVAAMLHLLRIAVRYNGARAALIRPNAAAGFAVAAASLRLIDGLRSAPPRFGSVRLASSETQLCFRSEAALTKGRRRSVMKPLPWIVPLISPDASMSDEEMAVGLQAAFSLLPASACSMFQSLALSNGSAGSLPWADGWGPACDRATPARIVTALAWLFQWAPLSLTPSEARSAAQSKHAPRHVMPELGRLLMLPAPARKELGYWGGKGRPSGRLSQLENRYSREAEEVLQVLLRAYIMRWVRSRLLLFSRQPLAFFAPPVELLQEGTEFGDAALVRALDLSA